MHITGLMNQAPTRLRFAHATYRGVQRGSVPPFAEGLVVDSPQERGVPQFSFYSPPRVGAQGVEIEYGGSAGGLRFPLPARRLDSRFRGNDKRGSEGLVPLPGVWGAWSQRGAGEPPAGSLRVSLRYSLSDPPRVGDKGGCFSPKWRMTRLLVARPLEWLEMTELSWALWLAGSVPLYPPYLTGVEYCPDDG